MALRAAKIDAQRNLLEVINGVRVTAGTTVKDMMLESDIIGTRVKGMLQGSFETASTVSREDGSWVAAVTMAVCLDKGDALCKAKPSLAAITQPSLKGAPPEARFSEADLATVKKEIADAEVQADSADASGLGEKGTSAGNQFDCVECGHDIVPYTQKVGPFSRISSR